MLGQGGNITVQAKPVGTTDTIESERSRLFTSATMKANGLQGGTITALADDVYLLAANLEAKGALQGGTILIGGDYQGKNSTIANAATNV